MHCLLTLGIAPQCRGVVLHIVVGFGGGGGGAGTPMCKQPPHREGYIYLENATHCGASLSEQLKSVVGFLQLLKTVLFDFAKNAGILRTR